MSYSRITKKETPMRSVFIAGIICSALTLAGTENLPQKMSAEVQEENRNIVPSVAAMENMVNTLCSVENFFRYSRALEAFNQLSPEIQAEMRRFLENFKPIILTAMKSFGDNVNNCSQEFRDVFCPLHLSVGFTSETFTNALLNEEESRNCGDVCDACNCEQTYEENFCSECD